MGEGSPEHVILVGKGRSLRRLGGGYQRIPGFKINCLADIAPDPDKTARIDHRPDIIEDRGPHARGRNRRHKHRHDAAHRGAQEHRAPDAKRIQDAQCVLRINHCLITFRLGIVIRAPPAAHIGRNHTAAHIGNARRNAFKIGGIAS